MNLYKLEDDFYINVNHIISVEKLGENTIISHQYHNYVKQTLIFKNFDVVINELYYYTTIK